VITVDPLSQLLVFCEKGQTPRHQPARLRLHSVFRRACRWRGRSLQRIARRRSFVGGVCTRTETVGLQKTAVNGSTSLNILGGRFIYVAADGARVAQHRRTGVKPGDLLAGVKASSAQEALRRRAGYVATARGLVLIVSCPRSALVRVSCTGGAELNSTVCFDGRYGASRLGVWLLVMRLALSASADGRC